MIFEKDVRLKNGKECTLRNAEATDARDFLEYFELCHAETPFLTTYPDETEHNLGKISARLSDTKQSEHDIEILAYVDGYLAGSAGINMIRDRDKTRHRAEFGISILKEYWGLGIGNHLTESCIECAKEAGYLQVELDVVSENKSAFNLYRKYGFVEYGRNPRGFKTRGGDWQELILMRLEL